MQAHRPIALSACWLLAGLIALVCAAGPARAATKLHPTMLSDFTDGVSEFRPRIVGEVVVWQRGTGAGSEVMRWRGPGTQALNLTGNGVADENPETDGIHIVWQQTSGLQHDIAVYDMITETTTILSTTADETLPCVSGPYLSWVQKVDADGEVFVDPGPVGNWLTGNQLVERNFHADGVRFVWTQADELSLTPGLTDDTHDIVLWNAQLQQLYILAGNDMGTPTDDIRPVIAGGVVVWQAGPDGSADIWYGGEGSASVLYTGGDERNPDTDGSRVIWEHWDGQDFDLYLVDLASPNAAVPFTSDAAQPVDDLMPQIEGNNIVWVKDVASGDSEIWYSWNGGAAQPLWFTQNNGRDDVRPRLDGDQFVYESCVNLGQPNERCDVVYVPEPRAAAAIAAALAALRRLAARARRNRELVPAAA